MPWIGELRQRLLRHAERIRNIPFPSSADRLEVGLCTGVDLGDTAGGETKALAWSAISKNGCALATWFSPTMPSGAAGWMMAMDAIQDRGLQSLRSIAGPADPGFAEAALQHWPKTVILRRIQGESSIPRPTQP